MSLVHVSGDTVLVDHHFRFRAPQPPKTRLEPKDWGLALASNKRWIAFIHPSYQECGVN